MFYTFRDLSQGVYDQNTASRYDRNNRLLFRLELHLCHFWSRMKVERNQESNHQYQDGDGEKQRYQWRETNIAIGQKARR